MKNEQEGSAQQSEREAFYASLAECEKLTGHKPTAFDIWLLARGLMSTSGRAQQPTPAATPQPAPVSERLPHPGSPEASAMIDSVLAEYHWPANHKNAARAGYVAAMRILATTPASGQEPATTEVAEAQLERLWANGAKAWAGHKAEQEQQAAEPVAWRYREAGTDEPWQLILKPGEDEFHSRRWEHEPLYAAQPPHPQQQAAAQLDVDRYRWLRDQHWFVGTLCVTSPKNLILGSECLALDRLDQGIDAWRTAPLEPGSKGKLTRVATMICPACHASYPCQHWPTWPEPVHRQHDSDFGWRLGDLVTHGVANTRQATAALTDVIAERERQQSAEGWSTEHDDGHVTGAMAAAGGCYALMAASEFAENESARRNRANAAQSLWPWGRQWWKTALPRRMLVKAAALILAEIERLDRMPPARNHD